ncbi:hypothetical protein HPB48_014210 [Haemaphysalis longicornis]|uniref:Uncharacterized protein n=1 Tax=Haemaphysalis longicornis TaxID=44386 RepID=A0A9J6FKL5_HAELO|nr:hypothetical protein HPB48_014210 [Haemaphysalis longicornis]
MYPEIYEKECSFCGRLGTLRRVIGECDFTETIPPPLTQPSTTLPTPLNERWETLLTSPALEDQLVLISRGCRQPRKHMGLGKTEPPHSTRSRRNLVWLNKVVLSLSLSLLSTVIASGKVLNQACLDFPAKGSQAIVLIQGIGKNRSLSDLTLCGWLFQPRVAVAFSNMLCSSHILKNIAFFETLTTSHIRAELLRGLASNYTLLERSGLQLRNHHSVYDRLRRNQSLLYQASRFVLPPLCNTKKAASAFEKVSGGDAFRAVISQLAGLTEAEAAELVTRRRRYLDENFLVVAGVYMKWSSVTPAQKCRSTRSAWIAGLRSDDIFASTTLWIPSSRRLRWYNAGYPEVNPLG